METIIGLIPNDESINKARKDLESAGCAQEEIDILVRPADVWQRLGGREKVRVVFKYAAIGVAVGLLIGAIYGIPAGIYNCSLMDCPMQTTLILWALVSFYWVVMGAFVGAIVGLDRFEDEFYGYVEGVERGQALIVVRSSPQQASAVMRVLEQDRGILIHDVHEEPGEEQHERK